MTNCRRRLLLTVDDDDDDDDFFGASVVVPTNGSDFLSKQGVVAVPMSLRCPSAGFCRVVNIPKQRINGLVWIQLALLVVAWWMVAVNI